MLIFNEALELKKFAIFLYLNRNSTKFVLSRVVCSSSYSSTLLNCSHDAIGSPSTLCRSSARAVHLSCAASDDTSRSTYGVKSSHSGMHTLKYDTP